MDTRYRAHLLAHGHPRAGTAMLFASGDRDLFKGDLYEDSCIFRDVGPGFNRTAKPTDT